MHATSQQCDICLGREPCHVCGNRIMKRKRDPDMLDMYFCRSTFYELTLIIGGDEGPVINCNLITPSLDQITKFQTEFSSREVKPDTRIFAQLPDVTYADQLGHAHIMVASEKIWNWQSQTIKTIVAIANEDQNGKEKSEIGTGEDSREGESTAQFAHD